MSAGTTRCWVHHVPSNATEWGSYFFKVLKMAIYGDSTFKNVSGLKNVSKHCHMFPKDKIVHTSSHMQRENQWDICLNSSNRAEGAKPGTSLQQQPEASHPLRSERHWAERNLEEPRAIKKSAQSPSICFVGSHSYILRTGGDDCM